MVFTICVCTAYLGSYLFVLTISKIKKTTKDSFYVIPIIETLHFLQWISYEPCLLAASQQQSYQ